MGYESHNALKNLNTIGVLIFLFHIWILIMMLCCKPLSKSRPRCARCYEYWFRVLIFTQIILLMVEGYFEMLIAGYVNFATPVWTTNGEGFGTVMAVYCLFLALIVLPALLIWMMFQSLSFIHSPAFTKYWRGLHYGLRTTRKWHLLYSIIFIVRRTLFVSVAFNMIDLPC